MRMPRGRPIGIGRTIAPGPIRKSADSSASERRLAKSRQVRYATNNYHI